MIKSLNVNKCLDDGEYFNNLAHSFIYDFVKGFDGLGETRFDKPAEKVVISNKVEILNLINSLKIEKVKLTLSDSQKDGSKVVFSSILILDVGKDYFTVNNSAINYMDRSFHKNISILIDTIDKRYLFNCVNMSTTDNGLKINLSIPKSVVYLNKKNNPIIPLDFEKSAAYITWEGMDVGFTGQITHISNHSLWVDFNTLFFSDSFYSMLSSSVSSKKPFYMPITVDINGLRETVIVKVNDASLVDDKFSFVFDFASESIAGKTALIEKIAGKNSSDDSKGIYVNILGSVVNLVRSNVVGDGGKYLLKLILDDLKFLDQLVDGRKYIANYSGEYISMRYIKDKKGFIGFDIDTRNSGELGLSNTPSENMSEIINKALEKSINHSKVKTSIDVIN